LYISDTFTVKFTDNKILANLPSAYLDHVLPRDKPSSPDDSKQLAYEISLNTVNKYYTVTTASFQT